jgi:hypothetical protein
MTKRGVVWHVPPEMQRGEERVWGFKKSDTWKYFLLLWSAKVLRIVNVIMYVFSTVNGWNQMWCTYMAMGAVCQRLTPTVRGIFDRQIQSCMTCSRKENAHVWRWPQQQRHIHFSNAFKKRGCVFLHLLSHEKENCLLLCLLCWRWFGDAQCQYAYPICICLCLFCWGQSKNTPYVSQSTVLQSSETERRVSLSRGWNSINSHVSFVFWRSLSNFCFRDLLSYK